MRFDDTRWEISQGFLQNIPSIANQDDIATTTNTSQTVTTMTTHMSSNALSTPGTISNELFRIAVDRFIRSLKSFD